jgi:imidazolonepropionase-like amidohydrolase
MDSEHRHGQPVPVWAQSGQAELAPEMVITGRIFAGPARNQFDGWIRIRDGKIDGLGEGAPPTASRGSMVFNAGPRTVMPGLVDAHVHLAGFARGKLTVPGDAYRFATEALDVAHGLHQTLQAGITTVRDCGYPRHSIFAVREAIDRSVIAGPHLVLCGRAIAVSGGHGADLGVEADGEDGIRRAARIEMRAGADWLKLMATGGTATPNEAVSDVQMTAGEISAAVDEAHRRGRRVCAHASNSLGAHLCVTAGVDSIEHGIDLDQQDVDLMAARGVWLSPTLACAVVESESTADDAVPGYVTEKAKEILDRHRASFQRALAAGVKIAASTDAGPPYFPLSGASIARELRTMAALGMPADQVLQAATAGGAEMLGIDGEVGSLRPGLAADVLVVDGDAFADVGAVESSWLVLKAGSVVRGEEHACIAQ